MATRCPTVSRSGIELGLCEEAAQKVMGDQADFAEVVELKRPLVSGASGFGRNS